MDDVGTIDKIECFAHVMISNQHTDASTLELQHQRADFAYRDGGDADTLGLIVKPLINLR